MLLHLLLLLEALIVSINIHGRGFVLRFELSPLFDVIHFLGTFIHVEVEAVIVAVGEATLSLGSCCGLGLDKAIGICNRLTRLLVRLFASLFSLRVNRDAWRHWLRDRLNAFVL